MIGGGFGGGFGGMGLGSFGGFAPTPEQIQERLKASGIANYTPPAPVPAPVVAPRPVPQPVVAPTPAPVSVIPTPVVRSEERRVGKECRARRSR